MKSIDVKMSPPASDNRSDKHMRKCAQTYGRKEAERRGEEKRGQGNMMIDSVRELYSTKA